ncbi:hypothetical protein R1sor_021538 [Riccia sorocarpa]|uniref:C2 domain-containing protein n=1 Tax=Riccia sorocarpa TaxID=122646 RepID=A0ABD3GJ81_9MARC
MSFRYQPLDRFPTGILHINLYFGRNLTTKDVPRPAELVVGKADPYVVINYNGRDAPRSKVCSDQGSSPEWNQHFYFPIREGEAPTLDKISSRSESRSRRSSGVFGALNSPQTILEPDTLEINVFDKNNFRHDYDMGRVRVPHLPKVISSTPNWYLEKQPFPVFQEVKGDSVSAGELWMEIGFQVVDESEFQNGWNSEPSLDGKMYEFKPRISSQDSLPQVEERDNGLDDKRRIKELIRENSRQSQTVEGLHSQLNVSKEEIATLELKLKKAVDQISGLDAQNKKLDQIVARLEREISTLSSPGFWQVLCCCFGSSRRPQDKREETAPLLGVTPNKPGGPPRPPTAASKPGPSLGTSKQG